MRDERLSVYERNKLYKRAKELREDIKHRLCKKDELMYPTPDNVRKYMNTEMKIKKDIRLMKDMMKAQGASFKEYDTERMRRGKITRR